MEFLFGRTFFRIFFILKETLENGNEKLSFLLSTIATTFFTHFIIAECIFQSRTPPGVISTEFGFLSKNHWNRTPFTLRRYLSRRLHFLIFQMQMSNRKTSAFTTSLSHQWRKMAKVRFQSTALTLYRSQNNPKLTLNPQPLRNRNEVRSQVC